MIAKHGHTNPIGVLEDLFAYAGYQDYDHQWIVIDRDEERTCGGGHTLADFNKAIADAKKHNVKVAWSNPCFEIWFLLHFNFQNTQMDRGQVYKKLSRIMEREYGDSYRKNCDKMYELLKCKYVNAHRNVKNLYVKFHKGQRPADSNPGTTVYQLVELLENLK